MCAEYVETARGIAYNLAVRAGRAGHRRRGAVAPGNRGLVIGGRAVWVGIGEVEQRRIGEHHRWRQGQRPGRQRRVGDSQQRWREPCRLVHSIHRRIGRIHSTNGIELPIAAHRGAQIAPGRGQRWPRGPGVRNRVIHFHRAQRAVAAAAAEPADGVNPTVRAKHGLQPETRGGHGGRRRPGVRARVVHFHAVQRVTVAVDPAHRVNPAVFSGHKPFQCASGGHRAQRGVAVLNRVVGIHAAVGVVIPVESTDQVDQAVVLHRTLLGQPHRHRSDPGGRFCSGVDDLRTVHDKPVGSAEDVNPPVRAGRRCFPLPRSEQGGGGTPNLCGRVIRLHTAQH